MAESSNLEDEMSRFEQEILGSGPSEATAAPAVAIRIGANTFPSVQEQLAALRAQVHSTGNNSNVASQLSGSTADGQRLAVRPRLSAPPRPPGFIPPTMNGIQNGVTPRPMAGPPPPPPGLTGPPRPNSFVPPQLRMRAATPAGPEHITNHMQATQPMLRPPAPPQIRPPPGMMPGMQTGMSLAGPKSDTFTSAPVRYTPPTVKAAKVVYSSKPVMNKPNKDSSVSSDKSLTSTGLKRDAPEPAAAVINQTAYVATQSTSSASMNASMNDLSQPPAKKDKKAAKQLKDKKYIRTAANDVWEDPSLADWDPNDFRVFCGDLGNEVTDEKLAEAFKKYPSLQRSKVIRDRRTHKTKGYGFISFKDPIDYTRAMREMNGKYVGNRPIKLRKSNWKDRNVEVVKKKEREKKKLGFR
ncbi:RNA-binding protein 42-like [Watersipora subatra]|uniref:RNA-binding protein 42-like n=1 Tax=Watersipora subatra TaxID=2589382 RepID=UPI00355C8880